MIMVVNSTVADAESLKKLIQFMDAPHVCSATPAKWLQKVGKRRLEAVFVGPNLSSEELETVVGEVGALDPNVPIVMINASEDAC
jgi:hypothetical protein